MQIRNILRTHVRVIYILYDSHFRSYRANSQVEYHHKLFNLSCKRFWRGCGKTTMEIYDITWDFGLLLEVKGQVIVIIRRLVYYMISCVRLIF